MCVCILSWSSYIRYYTLLNVFLEAKEATLNFFLFFFFKDLFIIYLWLRRVLLAAHGIFVEACGIFCCGTQAFPCGAWASL